MSLTAKDFAIEKIEEIIQLCNDARYIENRELRIKALMQIENRAKNVKEHLEYLEVKEKEN